jgi:hypothetical protein
MASLKEVFNQEVKEISYETLLDQLDTQKSILLERLDKPTLDHAFQLRWLFYC